MKCKKCGAEIHDGCVYCSVCGTEVQLVPDYNLLDEDILGGIVQHEANAVQEKISAKKKKSTMNFLIWGGICMVLLAAVLTLFFVFKEVQKRQQNTYEYQYQKAQEYAGKGELTNAVSHYKRALELKPEDKDAKTRLLEIYLDRNDEKEAVAILKSFVKENKKDKDSIQKLISIYDKNKEYDKILALCEEVKCSEFLDMFTDYMVDQPKFNKISGTYHMPLTIVISSEKKYDIFYTVNGQDPIAYGLPYKDEIHLKEGTTTIQAVAQNEKGIYSEPVKAEYIIHYEPPATPSVKPAGGVYTEPQMIEVSVPPDCTAYYTWDGSDPSEGSFRYTGPLEMPQGNQVLSVVLVGSSGLSSNIYRVNYVYMP